MKHATFAFISFALILLLVAASPQEKRGKAVSQEKHMQIMEMMGDSAAMDMMMGHIASNQRMSEMMMQKMISHAQSDSTLMKSMVGMMMENGHMHSMMMRMMGSGMMGRQGTMQHDGMMKHDMPGKK